MKKLAETRVVSFFINSKTVGHLVGKILLMLAIPYTYLLLCGLVFDYWLKWYHMVMFIFFSFVGFYLVAFTMIGIAIVRYVKSSSKAGTTAGKGSKSGR